MRSNSPNSPKSLSATVRLAAVAATVLVSVAFATATASPNALSGSQEVPPVVTKASGRSTIVVHDDLSVTGAIDTSSIDGVAAHIHVGATGTNGPVIVTLTKVSTNQWSVPVGTKLTAEQYQSYKAGLLYVNVHSDAHASGEIRLQLAP